MIILILPTRRPSFRCQCLNGTVAHFTCILECKVEAEGTRVNDEAYARERVCLHTCILTVFLERIRGPKIHIDVRIYNSSSSEACVLCSRKMVMIIATVPVAVPMVQIIENSRLIHILITRKLYISVESQSTNGS